MSLNKSWKIALPLAALALVPAYAAVQAAADAGDSDEATRLDDALQSAYTALSCAVNPIPVKTAMALLGFNVGDLRLPLVNATAEERATVRAELVARGLIG